MKSPTIPFLGLKALIPTTLSITLAALTASAQAADPSGSARVPQLTIDASQPGTSVSPTLYGLMTEEINHSYDGGLYAELIQNRIFKDNDKNPDHWSVVQGPGDNATISLDANQPINEALTACLKLDATHVTGKTGVANDGFWGIPVKPETTYRASFYAKRNGGTGPLTVAIESKDGVTTYAQAQVTGVSGDWQRYSVKLTTGKGVKPTADTRFVISTKTPGTFWFNLVSLFPPTWNDRANGNRIDLMQMMVDMKPTFLRCPGGNYLEGDFIATRFDWKKTIHDLSQRPGHAGCWNYRSSDGLGLLEFMEWCEDIHVPPVLAVFAGYALKHEHVEAGPQLQPYVQEALDELEYVTGDQSTKWGAQRVLDGHPEPFKLTYVEIGNEDFFDRSGSYDGRFAQFYDAIKAKYPKLQLIATAKVKQRTPDVMDDHFYRSALQMEEDTHHYDKYDRATAPKVFVGEWATREGAPTTNLNAALGDAAWMTGMERNSDEVVLSCYAPLFVNVNPGGMQWKSDLIGYDALTSYGSPSYYVQKMFSEYLGDKVVPTEGADIPTRDWAQAPRKGETTPPPAKKVPTLFWVTTRASKTGSVYVKLVNTSGVSQPVRLSLKGLAKVQPKATLVTLTSEKPTDTNSITEPTKITPVKTEVSNVAQNFTQNLAPYSVNVLQIQTR